MTPSEACLALRDALFEHRLPGNPDPGWRAFRFVYVECVQDGKLAVHVNDGRNLWERHGIESPESFVWEAVQAAMPAGWEATTLHRHPTDREWPCPWEGTAKDEYGIDAFPTLVLLEAEDGTCEGVLVRDPHTHHNAEARTVDAHPEPEDARALVARLRDLPPGARLEFGWYKEGNVERAPLDAILAAVPTTAAGQASCLLYRTTASEWLSGLWHRPGANTLVQGLNLASVADFHGSRVSAAKRASRPGMEGVRAVTALRSDWGPLLRAVDGIGDGKLCWHGPGYFERNPAVLGLCTWWNTHAPEAVRSAAAFRLYVWSDTERQFHAGDPEEPALKGTAFSGAQGAECLALFEQEGLPSVVAVFARGHADQVITASGGVQIVQVNGQAGYTNYCSSNDLDESYYGAVGLQSLREAVRTWHRYRPMTDPPHPVSLPPSWGLALAPDSVARQLSTLARAPSRYAKELWRLMEAARTCDTELRGAQGRTALHAVLRRWGNAREEHRRFPGRFPPTAELARLPLPGEPPWDGTGVAEGRELPAATLIARGADPFAVDDEGVRPWDLALAQPGFGAVLLQMVRAGGPEWAQRLTRNNWITLVRQGRPGTLRFLVEHGGRAGAVRLDPPEKADRDRTLLYQGPRWANGYLDEQSSSRSLDGVAGLIESLVAAGVDPLHVDALGYTALEHEGAIADHPDSQAAWGVALATAGGDDPARAALAARSAVFAGSAIALNALESAWGVSRFLEALGAPTPAGNAWQWLLLGSLKHQGRTGQEGFARVAQMLRRHPERVPLEAEAAVWACTLQRRVWLDESRLPDLADEAVWERAWARLDQETARWAPLPKYHEHKGFGASERWRIRPTPALARRLVDRLLAHAASAREYPADEDENEYGGDWFAYRRMSNLVEDVTALAATAPETEAALLERGPAERVPYLLACAVAVARLLEEPYGSTEWRENGWSGHGGEEPRLVDDFRRLFARLTAPLETRLAEAGPEERASLKAAWPSVVPFVHWEEKHPAFTAAYVEGYDQWVGLTERVVEAATESP